MKVNSDIEAMILEYTRAGKTPRYIIIGFDQYKRWAKELIDNGIDPSPNVNKSYMGCDIILCNSDIIEVVAEPKDQYSIIERQRA